MSSLALFAVLEHDVRDDDDGLADQHGRDDHGGGAGDLGAADGSAPATLHKRGYITIDNLRWFRAF